MKKYWISLVVGTAVGLVWLAGNTQQPTSSAPSPTTAEAKIAPGTLAQVEMNSDIDVKKAHPGDTFRTQLWEDVRSGDRMVLARKTILLGHVVAAQPHTKTNPESKLTIEFDKALLKDGSELPLHGVVERVQLSSIAVAAAADFKNRSYNPGLNPGSTTNIAMPASVPPAQDNKQSPTPGPTNIRDTSIVAQPDSAGTLTVLSSATKEDVKLKRFATLDVRITHAGQ
jgi:hypothetical protein